MEVGLYLFVQMIVDWLCVLCLFVNEVLVLLYEKGIFVCEKNCGYFVVKLVMVLVLVVVIELGLDEDDVVICVYFQIVDDCFKGLLFDEFVEQVICMCYGLMIIQFNSVFGCIVQEGWVECKLGYGWQFLIMLIMFDSLLQLYCLCLVFELVVLLELMYWLDECVIEWLCVVENYLFDGGIEIDIVD